MVRTYRNPQPGSLGGMFPAQPNGNEPKQSRSQNHLDDTKFGGLSSSSEEFTSPIPNQQMYPNHQFSPTPNNIYQNLPTHPQRSQPMPILNHHHNHQQHYGQAQGQHYGGQASQGQHYGGQVSQGGQYREYRTLPPNHGSRLGGRHAGGGGQTTGSRPGRPDSLGNIIILPKQFEVGLCQGCHNIFDGGVPPDVQQHHRQHPPPPTHQGQSLDYGDLLNQKRKAEIQYRNSADPFVNGSMRSSNSEQYLPRVAEPEDFGLQNGLNDLSNVLSRMQNNLHDPDESMAVTSVSYPNSAAANQSGIPQEMASGAGGGRQSWSAPQNGDPFGFNGPNSIMPGPQGGQVRRSGPGEGPSYGRAKLHADRDRIRQAQMSGSMSFNDPMERLRTGGGGTAGGRRNSYNQAINGQYTPSFNGGSSAVRSSSTRDPYLRDLENQIAKKEERKRREQTDHMPEWWEKNPQPQVQIPSRPHPSQTADQRPDPKVGQRELQDELRIQMEEKKRRAALEKQIEKEEEAKLERRIQEQQDRMKREFDEEQAKKKAKEQAKLKRQEEMARRQQEIQKEAEKQKKEAAERKFQERREQRERRRQDDHHDSDGSTPPPAPVRSNSPPIPAVRRSKGDNSSSEFESGSMGFSTASEDDQENVALNQLSKMREHLDKRTEDLGLSADDAEDRQSGNGRRRSSVWEGLAEV